MKTAYASKTCGDSYHVTYSDSVGCDCDVPYRYIAMLVKNGYRVEINNSNYRAEGEPATEVMEPEQ